MARAIQFDGSNFEDVLHFSEQGEIVLLNKEGDEVDDSGKVQYAGTLRVHTSNGIIEIVSGDWIIENNGFHVASGFLEKEKPKAVEEDCCS